MSSLPPRRGAYGFDAPYAPLLMALGGACLLALCLWRLWHGEGGAVIPYRISIAGLGVGSLWLFLNAGCYVHTTRVGKFAVWADLLDRLELKGDERLLDIGCGRGAVLLMAAQACPADGPSASTSGAPRINRATPSRSPARTRPSRAWPSGSSFTPPTCVSCPLTKARSTWWSARWRFTTCPARSSGEGGARSGPGAQEGRQTGDRRHPPHACVRQRA